LKRRRKRDKALETAGEVAADAGVTAMFEFPPVGIAVGIVAGIGVLGFLAWRGFSRMSDKKNTG